MTGLCGAFDAITTDMEEWRAAIGSLSYVYQKSVDHPACPRDLAFGLKYSYRVMSYDLVIYKRITGSVVIFSPG